MKKDENNLGYLDRAIDNDDPASTASDTSVITFLNAGFSICLAKVLKPSLIGISASTRVDSCLVNTTTSFTLGLERISVTSDLNTSFFKGINDSTTYPLSLSMSTAAVSSGASMVPSRISPSWSFAL